MSYKSGENLDFDLEESSQQSTEMESNDDSFERFTSVNANGNDITAYVERIKHKKYDVLMGDSSSTSSGSVDRKAFERHRKSRRCSGENRTRRVGTGSKNIHQIDGDNELLRKELYIQEGRILELRAMLDKQLKLTTKYNAQRKELLERNKILEERLRKFARKVERMNSKRKHKNEIEFESKEEKFDQCGLGQHMSSCMKDVESLTDTIANFNKMSIVDKTSHIQVMQDVKCEEVEAVLENRSRHQQFSRAQQAEEQLQQMTEKVYLLEEMENSLKYENNQLQEEIDAAVFGYQDELAVLETKVTILQNQLTSSQAKVGDLEYLNKCLMKELKQIMDKKSEESVTVSVQYVDHALDSNALQQSLSRPDTAKIIEEGEVCLKPSRSLDSEQMASNYINKLDRKDTGCSLTFEDKDDAENTLTEDQNDGKNYTKDCHKLYETSNYVQHQQIIIDEQMSKQKSDVSDDTSKNKEIRDIQLPEMPHLSGEEKKTCNKNNASMSLDSEEEREDTKLSTWTSEGNCCKNKKVSKLNALMEKLLLNEIQLAIKHNVDLKADKEESKKEKSQELISVNGEDISEQILKDEEQFKSIGVNAAKYLEQKQTESLHIYEEEDDKINRNTMESCEDQEQNDYNYDDDLFCDEVDSENGYDDKPNAIVESIETDSGNEDTGDELEMTDLNDEGDELDYFLQRETKQKPKNDEKPAGHLRYGKNRLGGYMQFWIPTKVVLDSIKEEDHNLCNLDVTDGTKDDDEDLSFIDDILEEIDGILAL